VLKQVSKNIWEFFQVKKINSFLAASIFMPGISNGPVYGQCTASYEILEEGCQLRVK